jgi:large subunit ribosomal protein L10e
MARKPAKMYRKITGPSYTRKYYMGGIPGSRISQFDTGNLSGDFTVAVSLTADEECQIRHTALEAARIAANRYLMKSAGRLNFRLKLRLYPHQVLRENKMATGAGADRVQDGMRRAFGKAVGTAARVSTDQRVFTVYVNPLNFLKAKEALRRASMKVPPPCRIVVDEGHELVKV